MCLDVVRSCLSTCLIRGLRLRYDPEESELVGYCGEETVAVRGNLAESKLYTIQAQKCGTCLPRVSEDLTHHKPS